MRRVLRGSFFMQNNFINAPAQKTSKQKSIINIGKFQNLILLNNQFN